LHQEHAGRIRKPVKLGRQDVGDDAKRIEVGFLGDAKVGIESLRGQLVEAI